MLVVANLAVAFWAPFSPLSAEFAFDPARPRFLPALTCLFLHDPENVLHLLGNLVFLAAVGPLVEASVGPVRFAFVYVASGLAGVAAHWAYSVSTGTGTALIGASSAIAGCVGYCCVRFARRRVPIAPKFMLTVGVVAIGWVLLQAIGAFVKFGGDGGTSYVAHIGGFFAGLVLAFAFRAQSAASAEEGRERIGQMRERSPAAALTAAEDLLRAHPGDLAGLWEKVAALHAMGEVESEACVLVELVRAARDASRAIDCLAAIGSLSALTPVERMRIAETFDGPLRRVLLVSVAKEPDGEPQRPYALLNLAEASDGNDRKELIDELIGKYEFHMATELARAKGLVP